MNDIDTIISYAKKYVNANRRGRKCQEAPDTALLLEDMLRDAIIKYEDTQRANRPPIKHASVEEELFNNKNIKETKMYNKEENFTRLTYESSYGHKQIYELDHEDASLDDVLDGFYALLIGATWHPLTILNGMKDFALEKLESLNPGANALTDEE